MNDCILFKLIEQKIPLPANFMTQIGNVSNEIIYGYSYEAVSPTKSIKEASIPILVIHSKVDKVCPFYMGEDVYASITHSRKSMVILSKSKHVEGFFTEREEYIKGIKELLDMV